MGDVTASERTQTIAVALIAIAIVTAVGIGAYALLMPFGNGMMVTCRDGEVKWVLSVAQDQVVKG